MYYFCTLFNQNYLTRGLALINSLELTNIKFHLYIFAFDDETAEYLINNKNNSFTVIKLNEFETDQLKKVKKNRTLQEYCWTCTPAIINHSIKNFNLNHCTYIDADLYFFNSPKVLFDEMNKECSVLITKHNYTKEYDQSHTSGKFCVQFMYFKNDKNGMLILNDWMSSCIKWCYNRVENNKFGDQKYLDDWEKKFKNSIHILNNRGGGVAPWNIQQYKLSVNDCILLFNEKKEKTNLIFYHFHNISFYENWIIDLGFYKLDKAIVKILYKSYIKKIKHYHESIINANRQNTNNLHNVKLLTKTKKSNIFFKKLKRFRNKSYNFYSYKELKKL